MSKLANMFAVLNLDAEDDREEVEKPTSSKAEADAAPRKPEKSKQNKAMIVNYDGENLAPSSNDYRMPLVWIDLEMTGEFFIPPIINHMLASRLVGWSSCSHLLCQSCRCSLNACWLERSFTTGPDLVIRQSKECLDGMNEWCQVHHVASGKYLIILKAAYISVVSSVSYFQVLDFIRSYIVSATPSIAGNSVYMDLLFLKVSKITDSKYMPQLAGIFSHVIVDVSSITALCVRWFPK
ncbi:Oligoribonuclease, partial [Dichanthelium oligosanthes]